MIGRAIDYFISIFSPAWAMRRVGARATLDQINSVGGSGGGYDGGKFNRLTRGRFIGIINENAVPSNQIERLRWSSWDLYRNNPHARKIVRSLQAKVIGKGPRPISAARKVGGAPHVEFRNRAQRLWNDVAKELDYRGRPGRGGQSISGIAKTALQSVMLGGEVLFRFRTLTIGQQMAKRLHLPLQVQLIHPERLACDDSLIGTTTGRIYRGIELDADNIPSAYWISDSHPNDPNGVQSEPKPIPAAEICHVFVAEDIDQLRGTPWFAPILLLARDTADYQYNELKASAVASCVVAGYRRPKGAGMAQGIGIQPPSSYDLTDADGNRITHLQPGMFLDLGVDGEIQGFNPSRPTTNAEAWIQHMIRAESCGLPGTKASTLTGDYRNSSFSSERSADNDVWPELEGVQQWFYESFYQPIYEAVIEAGVESGYFEGVLSAEEFAAYRSELLAADWQGPVALSINPTDDVKAAANRIAAGISTPQIEAAKLGLHWRDLLRQIAEFREAAAAEGIASNLIDQYLGLDPQVNAADESADTEGDDAQSSEAA